MIILGIDAGISFIKTVIMDNEKILKTESTHAPKIKSVYTKTLIKIIKNLDREFNNISIITKTGIWSKLISKDMFRKKIYDINEIYSLAYGTFHLTRKKRSLIVSVGTGTSITFMDLENNKIKHVGGTGLGGGTLSGLSKFLLKQQNINKIDQIAKKGDLHNVDIFVDNITDNYLDTLPADTTASNFGAISELNKPEDIALGLINLITQNIVLLTHFISKNFQVEKNIVYVGMITKSIVFKEILFKTSKSLGYFPTIPQYSEYVVAIGSIIAYQKKNE